MSDFQFVEDTGIQIKRQAKREGFEQKLMRWGVVKNESQAKMLLLAFIAISFIAIIAINMNTFSSPAPVDDPVEDVAF